MDRTIEHGARPMCDRVRPVAASRHGRHGSRRALARALAVAVCVAVSGATEAHGQSTITKEYKIKATYLFNFAQFVEWPATAFANAAAPITIGVLGDDAFGPFIEEIVRGETIKNRPLVVRRSRTVDELKDCHILFVSKSEESRQAAILKSLERSSALTVGEVEGFARRGGVINFFLQGDKLRFEINAGAASRCGLRISSHLLGLGKIVETARDKERE